MYGWNDSPQEIGREQKKVEMLPSLRQYSHHLVICYHNRDVHTSIILEILNIFSGARGAKKAACRWAEPRGDGLPEGGKRPISLGPSPTVEVLA